MAKRPTATQRSMVTDSLKGMSEKIDSLLHNWMNPDLSNHGNQVADCRDEIADINHTLEVMESILKDDLYRNAGKES